jgi:hypothetical protein
MLLNPVLNLLLFRIMSYCNLLIVELEYPFS